MDLPSLPDIPGASKPSPSLADNKANLYSVSNLIDQNVVRYDIAEADETQWNKSYPYQLVVLEVRKGGWSDVSQRNSSDFTYGIYNNLIFTLPVNPESLTNSMPFAISLAATLGGVTEQHGGSPFRHITFSGSFGVVNERPSAGELQGGVLGVVGGVFAGTVQSIQGLATTASSLGVGEQFTSNLSSETPGEEAGDILKGTTGYYQFKALQQFLESYAEAKKTSMGRDLRLALFIWKENAAYLVTPQAFDVIRTIQSPFEYKYNLRLQAWRRIDPRSITTSSLGNVLSSVTSGDSFSLAKVHHLVSNATRVAKAANNVLKSIRKDAAKISDTFRQVALFCATARGIVKTANDLPSNIRKDFESSTRESWNIIKASFDKRDPKLKKKADQITAEVNSFKSGSASSTPTLAATLADDEETDFNSLIHPESLNLDSAIKRKLNSYVDSVLSLTSDDFRKFADTVFDFIADYSDVVGLNDATYDKINNRTPKTKLREATLDDFRALHTLSSAAASIQSLVINSPSKITPTTIEYVAGLANANGIAMRVPKSKFAVPFPYGSSFERLAQQYLGDATRWMEIVELNNLRAPYIDETGTEQSLLVNGSKNVLTLTDASNLALGQYIKIWSNVVIPEKRKIVAIKKVSATQWQVVVNGEADLDKFKSSEGAKIQWFALGTVNSQQVIFIPSDLPANPDILKYVPQEEDFDRILTLGEIDGMLTDSGDLVVTPEGNWPTVTGLASLIQWARVALNTPIKSLSLHPEFGIDAQIGASLADASAADILKSIQNVLRFNPSFSGVNAALIDRKGPTTQISLELGVKGVDALLPISFSVVA